MWWISGVMNGPKNQNLPMMINNHSHGIDQLIFKGNKSGLDAFDNAWNQVVSDSVMIQWVGFINVWMDEWIDR